MPLAWAVKMSKLYSAIFQRSNAAIWANNMALLCASARQTKHYRGAGVNNWRRRAGWRGVTEKADVASQ